MTAVALIARPGVARERLASALRGIGMTLVLEADPAESGDAQVAAAGAQALVIALDAGTEDMLDRFDNSLADPAITVLLEEADVVAARSGWDEARWSRHIAAKLGGHDRVIAPQPARATEVPPAAPAAMPAEAGAGENEFDPAVVFPQFQMPVDPATPAAQEWNPFEPPVELPEVETAPIATADEPSMPTSATFTGGLSLVEDDFVADVPVADVMGQSGQDNGAFRLNLVELDAGKPAVTGRPAPQVGAVLIEGGLGAPDALRRLLGGIPEGFPLAVLVRIMLEGGRYDSLVKQMKRVATLPMKIARARDPMQSGVIYFLAPSISVEPRGDGLVFVEADPARVTAGLHEALLAEDSAQLVLSGANPDLVDAAVEFADRGAWLAAQAPETCYDATVPNALILRGAPAAPAAELVGSLVDRWPARRAQA